MKIITLACSVDDEESARDLALKLQENDPVWHFNYQTIQNKDNIKELDDSLGNSDHVLFLITKHLFSISEISTTLTALSNEKYKFLIFNDGLETDLQTFNFSKNYDDGFQQLLESIGESGSNIIKYTRIQRPGDINPFGAVRAEYFTDSHRIADIFYPPEEQKYDFLISSRPVIIEGGRGSGKTMCLRSLEAPIAIERTESKSITDPLLNYFGIYMHINRGSFVLTSEKEIMCVGEPPARILFLDDLNLQFTEQLLRTIKVCIEKDYLEINPDTQKDICNGIVSILGSDGATSLSSFNELLNWIDEQKRHIRKFLAKKIMNVEYQYEGRFTEIITFNKICELLLSIIPELKEKTVFLLLDEYENLFKSQQIIVNTLLKQADSSLTLKIATKFGGVLTTDTLFKNQPLQETNDYAKIGLDYNLADSDDWEHYKKLLLGITKNMLSSKYAESDIQKLLEGSVDDERVHPEQLKTQLKEMFSSKIPDLDTYSDSEINIKISYYKNTLIFRELYRKKLRKRQYSGFHSFAFLSSGIVRYFLELCGMAYYIAHGKAINIFTMLKIPPEIQSDAVHSVSDALIDKLALGIEDHGVLMQRFVMNLGELLRHKLLFDNNEPETIGFGITGSMDSWPQKLKDLMLSGVKESVFQKIPESKMKKPKNSSDPRSNEFYLNRIYAPTLGINHTARWRAIKFTPEEINEFVEKDRQSQTKLKMLADLKKNKKLSTNQKLDVRF